MSKNKFWIPEKLYKKLLDEADKYVPFETGGVFMGYYANDQDIVVTHLIGAGSNAIHKKSRFTPEQDYQLEKIDDIYKQKGLLYILVIGILMPIGKAELSFYIKEH